MILCLDSGNTRIKWGMHDGQGWVGRGALLHADVAALASLTEAWPSPEKILLANVAGHQAGQRIRAQLGHWRINLREVLSSAQAGGVTNLYENPAQLGVDRWCALLGARGLSMQPCLVVMAGTATTIDTLDADGRFQGGLILPGLDLMRRALARDTAALPFARGQHAPWPRCTDDAIVTGAIEAQAGAIERAFARLETPAICLLSGGNADLIAAHLSIPCQQVDDLPLEGLCRLAGGD